MKQAVLYIIVSVLAVGLVGAAFFFVPDKNDSRANMSTAIEDPTEDESTSNIVQSSEELTSDTTTETETTE